MVLNKSVDIYIYFLPIHCVTSLRYYIEGSSEGKQIKQNSIQAKCKTIRLCSIPTLICSWQWLLCANWIIGEKLLVMLDFKISAHSGIDITYILLFFLFDSASLQWKELNSRDIVGLLWVRHQILATITILPMYYKSSITVDEFIPCSILSGRMIIWTHLQSHWDWWEGLRRVTCGTTGTWLWVRAGSGRRAASGRGWWRPRTRWRRTGCSSWGWWRASSATRSAPWPPATRTGGWTAPPRAGSGPPTPPPPGPAHKHGPLTHARVEYIQTHVTDSLMSICLCL